MTTTTIQSFIDPAFGYTDENHRQYEQLGYCIFDAFLTPAAIERCRREIMEMVANLEPGRKAEEIISAHHQDRWIFELACEPKILDMVERQIGSPNIVLWSTALIAKPPHTGRMVPWHQDAPYWNIEGKLAGGVWIPFDDVDEKNGAMSILPGWHRSGVLARRKTGTKMFTEEIEPDALPKDLERAKVQYILKAGQAAVHDTMIPHNSVPNLSDRWRRVLVLRYCSADSRLPEKFYENYRTGEKFPREGFLVRGRDIATRGYRTSPFARGVHS